MTACSSSSTKPDQSATSQTTAQSTTATSSIEATNEPGIVSFFAIDYMGKKNYDEGLPVIQGIEKKLNIKFKWEIMPSAGYEDALNIKLASGTEMPDIFYSWQQNADKLASSGALVALSDYFGDTMKETADVIAQHPDLKVQITSPDGKVYFLSEYTANNNLNSAWMIRQDWLDQLKLKAPTNLDELLNVLTEFKKNDLNGNKKKDEIPLGIAYRNYAWMMTYQWWGIKALDPWKWIGIDENNKCYVYVTTPEFKECMAYMQKLFTSGFINQDVLNVADFNGDISANRVGLFFGQPSNEYTDKIKASFPDKNPQYSIMMPPTGPTGKTGVRSYPNSIGTYFISAKGKNVKDATRVYNYVFGTEEGRNLLMMGIEGQTYTIKDGVAYATGNVLRDPSGLNPWDVLYNYGTSAVFPYMKTDTVTSFQRSLETGNTAWINQGMEMYKQKLDTKPEMSLRFTDSEVTAMGEISAQVDTYINETLCKILVGNISMNEWDNFITTIKSKNIEKLAEYYQAAFDRSSK
jgi:ABC-type sugar transport system, periplasmic component